MSVFIGYCHHGHKVAALMEGYADDEQIEDFAHGHARIEVAESVTMSGSCKECAAEFTSNMATMGKAVGR